jgi:hypothetical protein
MSSADTVFLLSPARCDGRRAAVLMAPTASFDLAVRLRDPLGAPIGEVFSFLSGLYFRGKLAYANRFGHRRDGEPSALVITTDRGLVPAETHVTRADLFAFAAVDVAAPGEAFRGPLRRDAERLALGWRNGSDARVVLLGSIATSKYSEVLTDVFGERLLFPSEFVGRGDMSRGGLLLRAAADGQELGYQPVLGASVRGRRPARLTPRR